MGNNMGLMGPNEAKSVNHSDLCKTGGEKIIKSKEVLKWVMYR